MTGEWWERKARSEVLLRARGVPINDWLPVIGESADDKQLRTPREVAERAVALYAVSVGAAPEEHENAITFLRERGLWDAASSKERAFLLNRQPAEQEVTDFTWRYDALFVLLWALGHVEDLPFPDETCDLPLQEFVLGLPVEDFVGRAARAPPTRSSTRPISFIAPVGPSWRRCSMARSPPVVWSRVSSTSGTMR